MSLEANKAIVRSYFEAVNSGNCDAILALTTEDFLFMTMARAPDWLQIEWGREAFSQVPPTMLICPLLGGPKSMLFWTRKEKTNAIQETHAGGDYRQAA